MENFKKSKDIIKKLQAFPETQKIIIFFVIMAISAVAVFFWGIKATKDSIGKLSSSLELRNMERMEEDEGLRIADSFDVPKEETGDDLKNSAFEYPYETVQSWQTYKNENYGFEIKYPSGFSAKEQYLADSVFLVIFSDEKFIGGTEDIDFFFNVQVIKTNLSAEELIKNNFDEKLFNIKQKGEIKIAGKQALQFESEFKADDKTAIGHHTVFNSGNDTLFSIEYHKILKQGESALPADIYQDFLSSFKLISAAEQKK